MKLTNFVKFASSSSPDGEDEDENLKTAVTGIVCPLGDLGDGYIGKIWARSGQYRS